MIRRCSLVSLRAQLWCCPVITLHMTAEEYQAAFDGIKLPEGPIEISQGVTVKDVPLFVKKQLTILKTGNSERVKGPVRWRLDRLLELIKSYP